MARGNLLVKKNLCYNHFGPSARCHTPYVGKNGTKKEKLNIVDHLLIEKRINRNILPEKAKIQQLST